MNPRIENVPIESIVVGRRLRKDYGDVAGLAESITDNGLLHPLVIDQDNILICGGRRLKALQQLGFEEVPVRRWQVIDDKHRRAIELAENVNRKDLTEIEKSRDVVKAVKLAREVDADFRSDSDRKGRPTKPGSDRRASELTGIPKTTIKDAEKHVAAVDHYPFLEQRGWKQYHAMEAAEALDKLPEEERPAIVALIDQQAITPRDAIRTIQNVAEKPPEQRRQIVKLAQSTDDRDRTRALAEAAELEQMPDPRLELLRRAQEQLTKAIRLYPDDEDVPQINSIIDNIIALADLILERTRDANRASA